MFDSYESLSRGPRLVLLQRSTSFAAVGDELCRSLRQASPQW